ncbi:hypothetical protein NDU88_004130 [Pleurodeles waltl]|uniref:Uncharacterized protein n=1 Tax=Pleurodeles waltl TaxID=8319 RepID=A0AAV7UE30_PLEWA|nr:hypothetical protein NDU88_004130 [Pleurodeles waltl]
MISAGAGLLSKLEHHCSGMDGSGRQAVIGRISVKTYWGCWHFPLCARPHSRPLAFPEARLVFYSLALYDASQASKRSKGSRACYMGKCWITLFCFRC